MKSTQKLSELTGVTAIENAQDVKGGFFFLSYLFGGYKAPAYQAPAYEAPKQYEAPKNNYYGGGKSGKKGH